MEKEPGCVHIYCGDGKGKTTAAIGLAVRAAGRGLNVLISRFLKNDDSGEIYAMKQIPGITVLPCRRSFGFTFRMNPEEKAEAAAYYTEQFRDTARLAVDGGYDLLVLDEIMAACGCALVPEQEVVHFLKHRPNGLEVVMTGRDPSEAMKAQADYISEIRMERHPYTKGIAGRKGIEF